MSLLHSFYNSFEHVSSFKLFSSLNIGNSNIYCFEVFRDNMRYDLEHELYKFYQSYYPKNYWLKLVVLASLRMFSPETIFVCARMRRNENIFQSIGIFGVFSFFRITFNPLLFSYKLIEYMIRLFSKVDIDPNISLTNFRDSFERNLYILN